MKLFSLYQKGRSESKRLSSIPTDKKVATKTLIFTLLGTILVSIPIVFLCVSLFTIYSSVRTMFWITLLFILISVILVFDFLTILNVLLLKSYVEIDEMQSIDTKAIFVYELFNPWSVVIGIFIDVVICIMAI